tara:strand:+ start:181 stop:474 length:294 start_codon:yes stop_codon:yes gene_type:complete
VQPRAYLKHAIEQQQALAVALVEGALGRPLAQPLARAASVSIHYLNVKLVYIDSFLFKFEMWRIIKAWIMPAKTKPVGRWQVGGDWERRAMLATRDS